ncbi:MAG: TolC family protein [Chitinispirillaceae bacterium]|nr:TolC family protein [Chitinispirillaceae bacterium]
MKIYRLGYLLTAVVAASAASLSLHDAQQLLMQHNEDIRSSLVEFHKAEAEVAESRSAWLPSLDAKASYQWLSERSRITFEMTPSVPGTEGISIDRTIGTNHRTELGIDLTYPLFTGFARKNAVAGRREQAAARRAMHDATLNRLSLALGLLYLQWDLSFREVDSRDMLCTQLAVFCRQIEAQYEAGTVIRSRMLEVQARRKLADVDLAGAKQKTDSLRCEIMSFIGSDDSTIVPDTTDLSAIFTALPSKLMIDTTRPELTALSRSMLQIGLMRKTLHNRHYPTLFGLAGVRYANPGLAMGADEFMGYGLAGLQLNWNLFDGMKGRAQEQQLQYRLELIDLERQRRRREFQKTMDLAVRQMEQTAQRLRAAREARDAAHALAMDLENCVEAGTATQADFFNALVGATQAELVEQQLKTAGKTAAIRACFAAGVKLEY